MRSVWAIAVNTIKQALRLRVAVVFIVLLGILLPVMGYITTGDGTLKGKLQTFTSYSLSLVTFLLSLLTIIISVYTLTSDIKYRQAYTVVTKPVRRFQVILGKLAGVLILDAFLLVVFAGMIYSITVLIPHFSSAGQRQMSEAKDEFFTARRHITPPEPEVEEQALKAYKELKEAGELDQLLTQVTPSQILKEIKNRQKLWLRSARPGQELTWDFTGIDIRDPNKSLFIKFKYDVARQPVGSQIYGQWIVGDYRPLKYGEKPETPVYNFKRKDPVGTVREMKVPADAVADDGFLGITFLNPTLNNTVVIFPLEGGLELLYKADSFTTNFCRSVVMIMLSLIFLGCLGFLAASFLSFPVAILLCLVVFFSGTISGFILDSFEHLGRAMSVIYFYTIKPLVLLLPRFDEISPSHFMVSGKLLTWSLLGETAGILVGVKSLLLLGLSLLIFTYREIAKLII